MNIILERIKKRNMDRNRRRLFKVEINYFIFNIIFIVITF